MYDFAGYVTKNDIRCGDGRVIKHGAFKDCIGKTVPLMWHHMHNDPNMLLGNVLLEGRPDGIYGYGSFNNGKNAEAAKVGLAHGDFDSMSIYANHLVQEGPNVIHGDIKEVSLVLAGANPEATIEEITFAHADGSLDVSEEEAIIHSAIKLDELSHAEPANQSQSASNTQQETVRDVWNSFTDEEKALVFLTLEQQVGPEGVEAVSSGLGGGDIDLNKYEDMDVEAVYNNLDTKKKKIAEYIVGTAVSAAQNAVETNQNGSEDDMGHNAFEDNDFVTGVDEDDYVFLNNGEVIQHDDINECLANASSYGTLKNAFLQHSISNLEVIMPDYKTDGDPNMINRPVEWVADVLGNVHNVPFAKVKSITFDITADEARAKGYVKGTQKQEEIIAALSRKVSPQTIYKKQAMDRDDLIDITDFDVVALLRSEMSMMLDEEKARAILVGDGRAKSAPDKIHEENVMPVIYKAADTNDPYCIWGLIGGYETTTDVNEKSNLLVDSAVKFRKDYRGSGTPVFYGCNDVITQMMLARDKIGHRLYKSDSELASAMRVSRIVEVPVMEGIQIEGASSSDKFDLLGIIVNLSDYGVGRDRGGENTFFSDFDIDYNKEKYLLETRMSGMLRKPYSAIALACKHV